ncbi:thermostable hemolysin [uncultured Paraglaciecola sp.]|uniref:thermostable hemolysin n=1 Tax=uncultured Paraglaciecola sp. TaxID=1765024 RepID=UPI00261184C9|nr:thermostable hemolysin [uncultured Paraglaciecola sp.]
MFQAGVNRSHSHYNPYDAELHTDVGLQETKCAERMDLERFIAEKYLQVHNARLNEYLPLLFGVRHNTELVGAVGMRPGLYRPMFLEQYLDLPIEQQVAALSNQPVDRCSLVEIGNLAIARKGYGPLLMAMMTAVLAEAGYEWMVFTVTEQVERLICRLGFKPHYLKGAEPDRLVGDKSLWGSYYENNPRVMVGKLETAMAVIAQNAELSGWVSRQGSHITSLACSLRDYRRLRSE